MQNNEIKDIREHCKQMKQRMDSMVGVKILPNTINNELDAWWFTAMQNYNNISLFIETDEFLINSSIIQMYQYLCFAFNEVEKLFNERNGPLIGEAGDVLSITDPWTNTIGWAHYNGLFEAIRCDIYNLIKYLEFNAPPKEQVPTKIIEEIRDIEKRLIAAHKEALSVRSKK